MNESSTNMKKIHGFCDLNVRYKDNKSLVNLLETLSNWGYHNVAINQVVEEAQPEEKGPKKKKKKGAVKQDEEKPLIPKPVDLSNIPEDLKKRLGIFQRVTVYFSTLDQAHKIMQSENLKLYDIVAVVPVSPIAFQHACGALDVDLIAMDSQNKLGLLLNRKLYNMAVDRNIFFELTYGGAISSSSLRKCLFSSGHTYFIAGKSRNVIISSDTVHPSHLRGPYDVVNLGQICGLSQDQAKKAITTSTRSVLLRGESRRRGKTVVFAERLPSPERMEEDSVDVSGSQSEEDVDNNQDETVPTPSIDRATRDGLNVKTSPNTQRKKMRRE